MILEHEKRKALKTLEQKPVISTQVISEAANNFIRKFGFDNNTCIAEIKFIIDKCRLKLITPETIELALNLKEQFGYFYYDSLHLACALENECKTFYPEDLHHKQKIKMMIFNPFR